MPYLIEQVGRNKYYVINATTGRRFGTSPVSKSQAIEKYEALTIHGEGLFDSVKAVLNLHKGIRLDYQPKIRKFLKDHGDDIITRIQVGRAPVESLVKKFVNAITFGSLEKMIKEKGYDDVFHLFVFIDIKNNQNKTMTIQLEKNEVINLIQNPKPPKNSNYMGVSFPEGITLNELLNGCEARMGKERYFKYDAFNNNCQVYILNLIQSLGNGEYMTPELNNFIYQDTATLEREASGWSKKLMRGTTNIASLANTVIEGRALTKKTKRKKN